MKRALVFAIAVVALAGCGSTTRVVHLGRPVPRPRPPAPTVFRFSAASNRQAARANVRKLVGVVVVPLGARPVARVPAGAPRWFQDETRRFAPSFPVVTARRMWVVHERLKKVVLFVQSHVRPRPRPEARYRAAPNRIGSRPSRSYEFPPIPGRSWGRWLNVDMAPLPDGSTVVSVAAGDEWIVPPPRTALVPGRVRRIDIVSRYGRRPSVLVHLRSRFEVASVVALINGLGLSRGHVLCAAMTTGPSVTLRFRAADGRLLARARVSGLLSGPCNPLELTVGTKRTVPLLGADLLPRLQRLLNVDLAPPLPRDVAGCLRRAGWTVRPAAARRLSAARQGRRWLVTFHLNGKVVADRPAPAALRRCLRAGPRIAIYG